MFGLGLFPASCPGMGSSRPLQYCWLQSQISEWIHRLTYCLTCMLWRQDCTLDYSQTSHFLHRESCPMWLKSWQLRNPATVLYSPKLTLFTACLPVSVTHLSAELLWAATAQKYNQQQQQHVCNYWGSFKKDRHNYLSAWTCLMFADIRLLVDLCCALPELWG